MPEPTPAVTLPAGFSKCERGNTCLYRDGSHVLWVGLQEHGVHLEVAYTLGNYPAWQVQTIRRSPEELAQHARRLVASGWEVGRWNLPGDPPKPGDDEGGHPLCEGCETSPCVCADRNEGYPSGAYLLFEYDLGYWGGNYSGTGTTAYVPAALVEEHEAQEAFRRHTGHDPVHVIRYDLDRLFDAQGGEFEQITLCEECGEMMIVFGDGSTHHLSRDGGTGVSLYDHDADMDHAARAPRGTAEG